MANEIQLRKKLFLKSIDYYRQYPDKFAEEVLGIKLNIYQCLLTRAFFRYNFSVWCLARGLGKTWLSVLDIVMYCLLYPNVKAGIIAPSFRQAKNAISEKYKDELCMLSPLLEGEESLYVCNTQKARIEFYNGSWIEAFPVGTDGARIRGARLHLILVDEAAYVPQFIIDQVVKPMAVVRRDYQVGETDRKYEGNKILLTSTASYRFNHLYPLFVDYAKRMLQKDNTQYFACNLPYQVGLDVGLFDEEIIKQQKAVMSSMQFEMEYLARFPKLNGNSWIQYTDLTACADLQHIETEGVKGFEYIMSIDVARVAGHDNTIIDVFKLHWFKDHVEVDLVYIESMNGKKFSEQAERVREVLLKFPGIIEIFQDTMTIGQGLSDELAKDFYNKRTGKWYPPLIDKNDEKAMEQVNQIGGVPIIYGIRATAEINHRMGYAVKNFCEKRWLHMYPMSVDEKIDLNSDQEKLIAESEETRSEVVNIEAKAGSGGWLLFSTKSNRKDRWSALCMGIYGATLIADKRLGNYDTDMPLPIAFSR